MLLLDSTLFSVDKVITMIRELAKQYGVENLRFTLKEVPLRICGFICYTISDDEPLEGEFEVTEERYRVIDNYKIGFKPTIVDDYMLAPRAYYIMDLEAMIRDGYASVRVVNGSGGMMCDCVGRRLALLAPR